jgi:hypothetical protein
LVCTHLPAIVGERVGADAARRLTGEEKVREIVAFAGTFCAPTEGTEDLRKKPRRDPPDPAEPEPCRLLLDVSTEPECPGDEEVSVKYRTAAMTTTAPVKSTHGRRRSGLSDLDSRTCMASAPSGPRQRGIRRDLA